jgi:hypothetical protein
MRFLAKTLIVALSAGLALGVTASAHANGWARHHHHRHVHMRVHAYVPAPYPHPYAYRYVPDYAYYVPTRVFRCYPGRQMVEDQVGLVVGYVPLGPAAESPARPRSDTRPLRTF